MYWTLVCVCNVDWVHCCGEPVTNLSNFSHVCWSRNKTQFHFNFIVCHLLGRVKVHFEFLKWVLLDTTDDDWIHLSTGCQGGTCCITSLWF